MEGISWTSWGEAAPEKTPSSVISLFFRNICKEILFFKQPSSVGIFFHSNQNSPDGINDNFTWNINNLNSKTNSDTKPWVKQHSSFLRDYANHEIIAASVLILCHLPFLTRSNSEFFYQYIKKGIWKNKIKTEVYFAAKKF